MKTIITILSVLTLTACGFDGEVARGEARDFATRTLGFNSPVVTCQDFDSDTDGYVSCTVVDSTTKEREAIECSGWFTWNSGCRLATGAGGRARRTN